jgi:hypothetical protein
MATNIQWDPAVFNPVTFNPNAGLAIASESFGNISDTLAKRKEAEAKQQQAESLADFRNRQQVEGAPQRAIAEEERVLKKSAGKGKLLGDIVSSAGGSHMRQTLADLESSPEYQAMSVPERADFAAKALKSDRRLFSDPTVYQKEVKSKLLDTGQFTLDEAEDLSAKQVSKIFPTLDKDVALKLMSSGSSAAGIGTTSAGKNQFDIGSPVNRSKVAEDIVARRGLDPVPDNILWTDKRYDIGRTDPTGSDIARTLARLASDGVVSSSAAQAAIEQSFAGDGKTLLDDFNFTEEEGYKKLKDLAVATQAQETAKTGGNQLLSQQIAGANNNEILRRLNPDQSTREARLSQILSGLPGGGTPNLLADTIDTDNVAPANTRAPTTASPKPRVAPAATPTPTPPSTSLFSDIAPEDIPETTGGRLFNTVSDTASGILGNIDKTRKSLGKEIGSWAADKKTESAARSDANLKKVIEHISKNKSSSGLTRNELRDALNTDLTQKDRLIIAKLLANHQGE